MKGRIAALAVLVSAAMAMVPAMANDTKAMIGKWSWTDYTVEVKECSTNPADAGLCATVTAGPKNVGLEMIRSKLVARDGGLIGQIAHPATGEIYFTKLNMKNADTWSLDGCTKANVCAKGDFARVK